MGSHDKEKHIRKNESGFVNQFEGMRFKNEFDGLYDWKFDFSAPVQAKLEISSPGDIHEQQADDIARKVVSGEVAGMEVTASANTIMPKGEGNGLHVNKEFENKLSSSSGRGELLDDSTRSEMEDHMASDLGEVRIHTDSQANEMSESINAKAFTHGQDIYFKEGEYDTESKDGKELLAHELVHTQQQGSGAERKIDMKEEELLNTQSQELKGPEPAVIIIPVAIFYKEPLESDAPSARYHDLHMGDTVEIIERLKDGWTKIIRREGEVVLEGYVRSLYVIAEKDIPIVHPRSLSAEEIESYYERVKKELSTSLLFPLDWKITATEISTSIALLEELLETGDRMAFVDVVMRLRKEGFIARLFNGLNDTHIRTQYHTLSRIAVLMEPEVLIEIANRKAKIEGGEELTKQLYRAARKTIKDKLPGNKTSKGDNTDLKSKAIELIKSMIGDKDQFLLDTDAYFKDFLLLKYDQIAYLAKGDRSEVIPELEGLLDLSDAAFEILMSEKATHRIITGTMLDYVFKAWELLKSETSANNIRVTDNTHKDILITQLIEEEKAAAGRHGKAGSGTGSPSTAGASSQQQVSSDIKELKGLAKEVVVNLAERIHHFLDTKLFPLFITDSLLLAQTNKMLKKRKGEQYKLLTNGVSRNDKTGERQLTESGSRDKLKWIDLACIWFYELGDQNLSTEKDPLTFTEDAWTTQQLRSHPNMKSIIEFAKLRAQNNNLTPFSALVEYGTETFYKSLMSRDITMIYLGSFYAHVTFDPTGKTFKIRIKNNSSLESGSRFRRDPHAQPGTQANKAGMIDSKLRGEGMMPVGGTLFCEWVWRESY